MRFLAVLCIFAVLCILHVTSDQNNEAAVKDRNKRGKRRVVNKWWCWEANRCTRVGGAGGKREPVCGFDGKLVQRIKFPSACHLAIHNCKTSSGKYNKLLNITHPKVE